MNITRSAPALSIMGIRGIPAGHGGFETFAARLAPFLVERGWDVTVYCQEDEIAPTRESYWQGVRCVHIGVGSDTALNSIRFDWACIGHALRERPPLVLTLGYNTACFGLRLRRAGIPHVINMDGIEWSRAKWGPLAKAWLYFNDWAGCLGADHLVADHPEIARLLATRVSRDKISTIPYGADVLPENAPIDAAPLHALGLEPGGYITLIARPEPENSVLELVRAFSARPRGVKLVVLGRYEADAMPYHAQVLAAAGPEVVFPGAIYDPHTVAALRRGSLLYLHGHRVGGTNPSLLEAMGAGNAVIAHDNPFNRGVAGDGARYFADVAGADLALCELLGSEALRRQLADANRRRVAKHFSWRSVLEKYAAMFVGVLATQDGQLGARTPVAGRASRWSTETDTHWDLLA